MRLKSTRQRGQALLMVTLALFAMFGLIGLAVDLGWAFFTKKAARAAADAAALAAAEQAIADMPTPTGPFASCPTAVTCTGPTPVPCTSATRNLVNGCLYAQQNGFTVGGNRGHQNVTIASDIGSPLIPFTPGDTTNFYSLPTAYYWVTVRVSESIPQLFSAILGNPLATSSARATAVVINQDVTGSLILLNRAKDCVYLGNKISCGLDFNNSGKGTVLAPGGILLASSRNGTSLPGDPSGGPWWAGDISGGQGQTYVTAPFTNIRGEGTVNDPKGHWTAPPGNGLLDGPAYEDPMTGKGQPPLVVSAQPDRPVPGGVIVGGTQAAPTVLMEGNYYATGTVGCGKDCTETVATGAPVQLGPGYFEFQNSGFGDYFFWGGLVTDPSSGVTVTFAPGRYVFVGVTGGGSNPVFSIGNSTTIKDKYPRGPNGDAGEILIFAGPNYPGLEKQLGVGLVSTIKDRLGFGTSGIKTGNNPASSVTLHGLNASGSNIPEDLKTFAPVVMWQDQQNSTVKYTPDGKIDISCGGDIDNPCAKLPQNSPSPNMYLLANADSYFWGTVYQPRGSWLTLGGDNLYTGSVQLISGAIDFQGKSTISMGSLNRPLQRLVVALVE